ncbi:MAG: serine protease [Pseudonocardia sp.]
MIVRSGARFRGLAAAAATVGMVALAVIVAPVATAAPDEGPGDGQASVKSSAIRPGVVTESEGGGGCTSNFIFTSGDKTFIGQAAHCAGTGDATEIDGCNAGSTPIGTIVVIKANDGTDRIGKLAYSSWLTMQKIGEKDENACQFNDFALVELTKADKADVNPTVPFFGGPKGLDRGGVAEGEQVFSYGNSPLRQGISQLSPKQGQNVGDFGAGWSHEVVTPLTPGVPGDSGSGFLDSDGDAMGVLSTLNLAPLPGTNGVADMAKALDYANAHGGLGEIELVLGTG